MKKISIHDYANARVLILDLPDYVQNAASKVEGLEEVATMIMTALGLNVDECEWMDATECDIVERSADDLTQDFEIDFKEAFADAME